MKKILSLLLVLMLLVAFAACGGTEDETEGAGAGTSPETQGTVAETEPATQAPAQSETESDTQTQEPEQSETQTEAPATTETESIDPETEETAESTDDTTGSTNPEDYEPEDGDVLFFKPTLDGLLDAEYLKSACYTGARTLSGTTAAPTTEDFIYFLWDGEFFYACAIVYDDDIVTRGEKYVNEAVNENPYCNDVVELWYTFDGDIPTGHAMVEKACLDAFGYKLFSSANEGILSNNFSDIEAVATRHIDEENPEKSYYICEFKFPCMNEFGEALDVDSMVYFASQIDDVKYGLDDVVIDVDNKMGQGAGAEILLGYADDYASGELWSDGYIHPNSPENNLVGFKWSNGRNLYPDIDTGDMRGWIELVLLETTPEEVNDQYADEFPTRLYELEIAQ